MNQIQITLGPVENTQNKWEKKATYEEVSSMIKFNVSIVVESQLFKSFLQKDTLFLSKILSDRLITGPIKGVKSQSGQPILKVDVEGYTCYEIAICPNTAYATNKTINIEFKLGEIDSIKNKQIEKTAFYARECTLNIHLQDASRHENSTEKFKILQDVMEKIECYVKEFKHSLGDKVKLLNALDADPISLENQKYKVYKNFFYKDKQQYQADGINYVKPTNRRQSGIKLIQQSNDTASDTNKVSLSVPKYVPPHLRNNPK